MSNDAPPSLRIDEEWWFELWGQFGRRIQKHIDAYKRVIDVYHAQHGFVRGLDRHQAALQNVELRLRLHAAQAESRFEASGRGEIVVSIGAAFIDLKRHPYINRIAGVAGVKGRRKFQRRSHYPRSRAGKEREELPPTQIGRALQELGITWIPAHSRQAKGRVERGFLTAPDRLVKGMRVAGVKTLEQANHYLETEFLPWVNSTLAVAPARVDDAHRPLEKHHDLPRFSAMWRTGG